MKRFLYIFVILSALLSSAHAKVYWYNATSLTGGGTSALDAINGQNLINNDKCIVVTASGQTYSYNLDSDSALTESSPGVISPDSNAGDKRWILMWKGDRIAIPDSTIDQGDNSVVGTIAWHIANASGASCDVRILEGTYDVTTNIEVPITMLLRPDKGGILDGSGALQINSVFNPGEFQVFGSSMVATFKIGGTTEIHPEWWGPFPNGANDVSGVLNKAIAASDLVGTSDGFADANIIVRPGRYYIAHNSVSTITTNFYAPKAYFIAVDNVVTAGVLLTFDFTESGNKRIDIGNIYGKDVLTDTAHYNIGMDVIGGDSAFVRIGALSGLYIGIRFLGSTNDEHVGMWDFEIDTILGCDYGIYATTGTTAGKAFEANTFRIRYASYCREWIVNLDTTTANSEVLFSNTFRFGTVEMHAFADHNGFRLAGSSTISNRIFVDGALIPPTGSGYILSLSDSASDNLFELSWLDWAKVYHTGGYNIFRQSSNHNTSYPALLTNNFGRSVISYTSIPTGLNFPWRKGDLCWNPDAGSGDVLLWACTASGTGAGSTWLVAITLP